MLEMAMKIGTLVRSLVDDVFVYPGLTGIIASLYPYYPRNAATHARVEWNNDTSSLIQINDIEKVEDGQDTADASPERGMVTSQ